MEKKTNEMVFIQSRLNAPKKQRNTYGNYNYRSCEDILEAVKPLLAETECVLTIHDEIVQVADRIYVKATATLTTSTGKEYTTTAFAREAETKKGMDESQITGSASSYARKYALNGLFCIDDNKDADALNTNKEYTEKPVKVKRVKDQDTLPPVGIAIAEVEGCVSRAELNAVWNKFAAYQSNSEFVIAVQKKASEYPKS
jgi:hypothetical protein